MKQRATANCSAVSIQIWVRCLLYFSTGGQVEIAEKLFIIGFCAAYIFPQNSCKDLSYFNLL